MKRIRFYRWLRYEVFKEDPCTYPTGLFSVIHAILFPLYSLYERQSRVYYFPQTNRYTIEGQKVDGAIFYWMNRMPEGSDISLKKNDDGIWQVSKA